MYISTVPSPFLPLFTVHTCMYTHTYKISVTAFLLGYIEVNGKLLLFFPKHSAFCFPKRQN